MLNCAETLLSKTHEQPKVVSLGVSRNLNLQHSLETAAVFHGVGVHSGAPVCMIIHPAAIDHGIIFERTDIEDQPNRINASWQAVKSTNMCTTLANQNGISVATVEHVLAALYGLGITNALITIDGPEVPMMDGCSLSFCEGILESGLLIQQKLRPQLIIKHPIKVNSDYGYAELLPYDTNLFSVEFSPNERFANVAGQQFCQFSLLKDDFFENIAKARSFGFFEDAQKLWAIGLAKGSSLDNTVVIHEGSIMNKDGLRYEDEFVRHKMLDAIGDMALAEYTLVGHYKACNPSHTLNYTLLKTYFDSLK